MSATRAPDLISARAALDGPLSRFIESLASLDSRCWSGSRTAFRARLAEHATDLEYKTAMFPRTADDVEAYVAILASLAAGRGYRLTFVERATPTAARGGRFILEPEAPVPAPAAAAPVWAPQPPAGEAPLPPLMVTYGLDRNDQPVFGFDQFWRHSVPLPLPEYRKAMETLEDLWEVGAFRRERGLRILPEHVHRRGWVKFKEDITYVLALYGRRAEFERRDGLAGPDPEDT